MVKIFCDKCGNDCELNAYELRIEALHNPCPAYLTDIGDAKLSDDHARIRFCLCQKCYRGLGLPNIYKAIRDKSLTWRNTEEVSDDSAE